MRQQASAFRSDDTAPYDRELIRSGGSRATDRRRQAQRRRPPPPRRERPVRRSGSFGRTLRNVLLVVLLAAVASLILVGMRAAAFNATVTDAPFLSTQLLGPLNGSDRVNVMMVGYGGADHDGAYLADSIQLLSIDPASDTTTIPIPRDLWIEGVDAFPRNGKINEVFSAGHARSGEIDEGAEALADVVSDVTGLEVTHWLTIDFQGFQEMVDAVGGVTIDNPRRFCWTTIEEFHLQGRWEMGCFDAGRLELNGQEALMYTRARYTSVVEESTDFARSERQARIVAALRGRIGDGGIGAIVPGLQLMDAMEGRIRTDLSAIDLFLLSGHLNSDRRLELTEDVALTATTNTIGQYVLVPIGWNAPGDYDGLQEYIRSGLAEPVADAP